MRKREKDTDTDKVWEKDTDKDEDEDADEDADEDEVGDGRSDGRDGPEVSLILAEVVTPNRDKTKVKNEKILMKTNRIDRK